MNVFYFWAFENNFPQPGWQCVLKFVPEGLSFATASTPHSFACQPQVEGLQGWVAVQVHGQSLLHLGAINVEPESAQVGHRRERSRLEKVRDVLVQVRDSSFCQTLCFIDPSPSFIQTRIHIRSSNVVCSTNI